jgi:TRAP-type C4-dicarboxylate transport system substrate-binding protein
MKLTRLLAAAAIGFGLMTGATMAQDKTLKISVGFPPGGPSVTTLQAYADYIEANSDLKTKVYALELLNLKEIPPGLRDGVTDVGYVLTPYYPAEYSEINLAANLSMLATTGEQVPSPGAVMAGVISEYVMLKCPDCQAQFKQQNQAYLGGAASPTYILLCTTPIRTAADLKGKQIRSGAANFGRWAEHFGATKVSIPGNDVYEALSQGVIDCAMMSATELSNLQLMDVTDHITLGVPGGVFAGGSTQNVNLDTWRGLTDAQRETVIEASALSSAAITYAYYSSAIENIEAAKEKGIDVMTAPEPLLEASADFVKQDVDVIAKQFREDYGLENVEEKIATITALVDKWKGLTKDIADDREALRQLYWDEIYSKVDPATYMMD